jgi:hypothetical protein
VRISRYILSSLTWFVIEKMLYSLFAHTRRRLVTNPTYSSRKRTCQTHVHEYTLLTVVNYSPIVVKLLVHDSIKNSPTLQALVAGTSCRNFPNWGRMAGSLEQIVDFLVYYYSVLMNSNLLPVVHLCEAAVNLDRYLN